MPAYVEDQETPGVEIDAVSPDGAAEKAGLKAGDILLKMDDHLLKDLRTYMKVLQGYRPGDKVTLTVVRGDKSLKVKATVGASSR
jgi:putative serine protease PepD